MYNSRKLANSLMQPKIDKHPRTNEHSKTAKQSKFRKKPMNSPKLKTAKSDQNKLDQAWTKIIKIELGQPIWPETIKSEQKRQKLANILIKTNTTKANKNGHKRSKINKNW